MKLVLASVPAVALIAGCTTQAPMGAADTGSGGSPSSDPHPGYAAPGSEPGVPGPSTRILQPTGSMLDLRLDSPSWLYVLEQEGLLRVPTPAEEADPVKATGELLDAGRLRGPWTEG